MNGCEALFNIYTKMLYFPTCECIRTVAVPVTCSLVIRKFNTTGITCIN